MDIWGLSLHMGDLSPTDSFFWGKIEVLSIFIFGAAYSQTKPNAFLT
jgi:hypothetical protein